MTFHQEQVKKAQEILLNSHFAKQLDEAQKLQLKGFALPLLTEYGQALIERARGAAIMAPSNLDFSLMKALEKYYEKLGIPPKETNA